MISPKGDEAFSGQSVILAITFWPFSAPPSFALGIYMSTSIFLLEATKNPWPLPISIVPTKSVCLRSSISITSPSSFLLLFVAKRPILTLSPFRACIKLGALTIMSLSTSGLTM